MAGACQRSEASDYPVLVAWLRYPKINMLNIALLLFLTKKILFIKNHLSLRVSRRTGRSWSCSTCPGWRARARRGTRPWCATSCPRWAAARPPGTPCSTSASSRRWRASGTTRKVGSRQLAVQVSKNVSLFSSFQKCFSKVGVWSGQKCQLWGV